MVPLMIAISLLALTPLEAPAQDGAGREGRWALAIHGGAGTMSRKMPPETVAAYRASLERVLRQGQEMLAGGATAMDVVEALVRELEDDPLFNAGRGSVFTHEGRVEMDAAIMDGRDLSCGAVNGVRNVRNPISLARLVIDESPHVFLAGPGANAFAAEQEVPTEPDEYFHTERRWQALQRALEKGRTDLRSEDDEEEKERPKGKMGTVGCVALDRHGNLAAGTSTGGMTNKRFGRVGDVPVIGAGTYASNRSAAVSCTGWGERFIMHTVARDLTARMEFGGQSLRAAAEAVVGEELDEGDGGLIAVDREGQLVLLFNTGGMLRGAADSSGRFGVAIWPEEGE